MSTPRAAAAATTEIFSQPEMWRRAIRQAAAGVALPERGTPVLVLGCGTSLHIGEAYASLRNSQLGGRTRVAIPTEIPYLDDAETIVVLSRSGTTSDLINAAERLRSEHRVIGLVGTPETALIDVCDDVIDLSYANETAIVQTRFATTAFTLLRCSVSAIDDAIVEQAEAALRRRLPFPLPAHIVFLGTGFSLGLAREAALKCIEASGRWAEAYAINEYQHGPISAAGPDTLVWPLSPISPDLAAAISRTSATVLTPTLDAQAELVAVHRLAVALALAEGRDPDLPPFLTRSVQLESSTGSTYV
ncbi:MAG: SIS domain-containing protein [Pseudonocardiales bacterium]